MSALPRPTKILAVMDDSDAQVSLTSALHLAKAHSAEIDVLVCVEPPTDLGIIARLSGRDSDAILEEMKARARTAAIARLAELAPDRGIVPTVAVGKAYLNIIWHVAETGCDFVIKSSEPLTGLRGFLHASNDQHLLRKCPCPVWLQVPSARPEPRRVIAAVDLDDWDAAEPATLENLNFRVVEAACTIAQGSGAEVIILHAWEALGEGLVWAFSEKGDARATTNAYIHESRRMRQKAMDRFVSAVRSKAAHELPILTPLLRRGAPEQVIEEASRDLLADVVVIGTVARTGLSGVFIGNTAENIVNSLRCPVLAIKPEGFVSPLSAP